MKKRIMAVLLALAIGAGTLSYAAPAQVASNWSTVPVGRG